MEYLNYKYDDTTINVPASPNILKTVFIITFCSTKPYHESFLKICVNRIRLFHPESDIIILNDSQSHEITTKFDSCVRIEKTHHTSCGEVNAYVWACEHKNEYSKYIFIHDSVFLINRLMLDIEPIHFRPLWTVSRYKSDDTCGADTDNIVNRILLNNKRIDDQILNVRNGFGSVIFGSMGVFNKLFIEFLCNSTNFLDIANMFHTRKLRSFFERILYIFVTGFYDTTQFNSFSICGDIIEQEYTFKLSSPLYSSYANNPYALKIWQGR